MMDDRKTRPGPVGKVLILMVRLYQGVLSPFIGRQCRFTPTCSEYFIRAVRARGALVGGLMGLWRILRCNPLGKGGYDPPE
ncbi:MAG: membrane protein insertion efficiency factor YidD [Planctomycetota bacterium]|nr:membrane protein insertion efficiency factor YidD [Planctomycetota bacterium]